MATTCILIIDIGKTHIKLHLLDQDLRQLQHVSRQNLSLPGPPYPHFDTDTIWDWLIDSIRSLPQRQHIQTLAITTHGATAALIECKRRSNALTLPILDYEFAGVASCDTSYRKLRPDYTQTLSPDLPLGLNLGRQLYWLQTNFPEQFARSTNILLYPQYWSWRFCGELSTEVTSLGCHTDLWEPYTKHYSTLAKNLDWEKLFPPIVPAWQSIGTVMPRVAEATGINPQCKVFAGVHDSNASYLRYLPQARVNSFAVVSTGTWTIAMSSNTPLNSLDAERDMLANVDINGNPVACSRFMGGREFEIICEQLGAQVNASFNVDDLQRVINAQVMALPNFSDRSGPFPNAKPRFVGETSKYSGLAIATLYCALVIDYQLDLLQATGDIFVEGSFLKNTLLCSALAQLRSNQTLLLSADTTGTVLGCALLTQWQQAKNISFDFSECPRLNLENLVAYRNLWRSRIEAN